ncbi:MarR family winged helix-turn-helix transcriptional regulator [Bacillus sp. EAC]|uniref:MarR family winged helix-turn-helix transcriptional regulator n=1 Tax=Bacillus sp. EAC TaxID=1978338 RepID=UPI000B44F9C5|nr:MarR family transcriptional regulator [Bacillus sp. EAC]
MLNDHDKLLVDDLTKLLIRVRKNWQKANEAANNSLTPPKYLLLHLLNKNKKMTVSELGKQIGLSSGAITTAVNKMVNNELIKRQRDLRDRRVTWLELTEQGYQMVDEMATFREGLWASLFNSLSNDERDQFHYLLNKIL